MECLCIDIGTFNLCAVVSDNGRQRFIEDKDSQKVIPSIVKYNSNGSVCCIGSEVEKRYRFDSYTVRCVKRIIGYKMDTPEMREYKQSCVREVVKGKDGFPAFKIPCFPDNSLTPVKVTTHMISFIAEKARKIIEKRIGELVITVPAFFNTQQRKHTKDAAIAAGICDEQNIHIVSEPVAAALHYGVIRPETQTIMVVDFGGGTLDLCIMRINNKKFDVIGTNGDRCLGGEDITNSLASFIEEKYYNLYNEKLIKVNETSKHYKILKEKLKVIAEEAKIRLSSEERVDVDLKSCINGILKEDVNSDSDSDSDVNEDVDEKEENRYIMITQKELNEKVMTSYLTRILNKIHELLKESNLHTVDRIVMIGGSCRIPIVKESLCKEFGYNKVEWNEQYLETAVALGAYQATEIAMKKSGIEYSETLPSNYGVIVDDYDGNAIFHTIIPKGTRIPCSEVFTQTYYLPDREEYRNHPTLPIEIPVKRCNSVEDCVRGSEHIHTPFLVHPKNIRDNVVDVSFSISSDGILFFEVKQSCDPKTLVSMQEICCINADL